MVEKGLHSFIKQKTSHGVDFKSIKQTLMRAGFPEDKIDEAFEHIKKTDSEAHRDVVAENDFLPPLNKEYYEDDGLDEKIIGHVHVPVRHDQQHQHAQKYFNNNRAEKGLFSGRLLRRDFILGFLFFFGLGYIILVFAGVFISTLYPEMWSSIMFAINSDTQGLFLLVLPLLLFPITIMLFSLIARRLHNLEIPGGVALVFLALFIPPSDQTNVYGMWAIYVALFMLFVLLVTKKGDSRPNVYGPYPSSRGSFFRRIFNV